MTALEAYQGDLTPIGPNGETLIELLRAPARAHPTSIAGQLRYVRDQWRGLLGADLDALLDRAPRHPRRHRRGGARAPPAVRRRRRRRRRRPRRVGRPVGPRGRAGAVLQRLRVDAAAGADRQEHPRLARPAVAALRPRHPDARRDPRRGARPARALGDHRPVAHRAVGAEPRVAADQGLARQPGRGGVGVLAGRLPRSPTTWAARRAWANLAAAGLGARRAAGLGHGAQPHGHRLALGRSSTPSGSSRCPSPPTPATRSAARTSPRTSASRSGSRTTTGTTATRPWCSSGATASRASGATSTTATTAPASRGTTPPSSTSRQAAVREQVIRTIVDVARRFPVIRFDAAMVLAKKHVRRLWFPGPGEGGGAIPSRAEFGTMSQAEFDAAMPDGVLARGRRPGRRRGPGHAAAGRGVLAARGLLRPDAGHAPRLQLGVHAHAPRRGQRGLPAGAQGDPRVRPRDPQALRQLHEQPRREVGGRAVRQGRQVHRRGDAAGDAARACRCSATASSRASPRSTGWSSGGRRWTSSPTRG